MTKIILQPNPRIKTVHRYDRVTVEAADGRREQVVTENDLTRAPGTKYTFFVGVNSEGKLCTGLDNMVKNPYAKEKSYRTPEWEHILKGKDEVLEQYVMEYKHGRQPGYYTNVPARNDRIKTRDILDKIPFYQTDEASWNLNDGAVVLDMSKPRDELLFKATKAHPKTFAQSYQELKPWHDYYVSSEEEDKKAKATKKKQVNAAVAKLTEIDELADETIINFCKVIGNIPNTKDLDREDAYKALDAMLHAKVGAKATIKEFNATYRMWKGKDTRAEFNARVLIQDMLNYRVIYNKGNDYVWQPPKDELGKTPPAVVWPRLSELVKFMLEPEYQQERDDMKRQYKAKLA